MTRPGYMLNRDDRGLTIRQAEVLRLRQEGKTQVQIAYELVLKKQRVHQLIQVLREKGYEV